MKYQRNTCNTNVEESSECISSIILALRGILRIKNEETALFIIPILFYLERYNFMKIFLQTNKDAFNIIGNSLILFIPNRTTCKTLNTDYLV